MYVYVSVLYVCINILETTPGENVGLIFPYFGFPNSCFFFCAAPEVEGVAQMWGALSGGH